MTPVVNCLRNIDGAAKCIGIGWNMIIMVTAKITDTTISAIGVRVAYLN